MGDVSSEPTMEEILSSIKRVIEESETAAPQRSARKAAARTNATPTEPVAEADQDQVLELSDRVTFPAVERGAVDAPAAESLKPEAILSTVAEQASRGPLEALSRMIVKPDVAGSDTLEGLVRDILRPMLRDWLDSNLPGIVEKMVAREIARISGRGI